jgi:hypothetical protein
MPVLLESARDLDGFVGPDPAAYTERNQRHSHPKIGNPTIANPTVPQSAIPIGTRQSPIANLFAFINLLDLAFADFLLREAGGFVAALGLRSTAAQQLARPRAGHGDEFKRVSGNCSVVNFHVGPFQIWQA